MQRPRHTRDTLRHSSASGLFLSCPRMPISLKLNKSPMDSQRRLAPVNWASHSSGSANSSRKGRAVLVVRKRASCWRRA